MSLPRPEGSSTAASDRSAPDPSSGAAPSATTARAPEPPNDGGLAFERAGSGSPVVLVHGFTQTGRSWKPVVERLTATHQVVTVDAPGHGGSGNIRADLMAGAAQLAAVGGRATYVGYSMGGRLCLRLALDHPDVVARLVLVGATAGLADPLERARRRAADEELADALLAGGDAGVESFLQQWLARPLFATLSPSQAGLDARRDNTAAGLASSLRLAGTGAQEPLWDRLAELKMPVLIMAGEQDSKFAAIGRRLVAAIGDNAELHLIEGAGHAAHLEQPEAFTELLRSFLPASEPGLASPTP
jgi:2-succinyl-6-hydroxy-2,4-cyclohexadiene-1-carboxylate synthase